jgi:hypothetical protein
MEDRGLRDYGTADRGSETVSGTEPQRRKWGGRMAEARLGATLSWPACRCERLGQVTPTEFGRPFMDVVAINRPLLRSLAGSVRASRL